MGFFESYIACLEKLYPETARVFDFKTRVSPNLICPETVKVPLALKDEAERIVRAFFALRSLPDRALELESIAPPIIDPGNTSVLMSYDFHVDESGHLRLIEINTNAAMSLITDSIHEAKKVENPFSNDFRNDIIESFREEARAAGSGFQRVAIVDEKPEEQRLLIEFLIYKELFDRAGCDSRVRDVSDLRFENGRLIDVDDRSPIDLVYNRHTDFYFRTDACAALRMATQARAATITPHPHEYRLLADKERLLELSKPGMIDALTISESHRHTIRAALIPTVELASLGDADAIWSNRKKWFFKPKRSFGGKAVYRGATITRSMFEQVLRGEFLAQEYVRAPHVLVSGEEFKYDLRFFAYRDHIQLACARVYKGQATNAQSPGGGIAALEWV